MRQLVVLVCVATVVSALVGSAFAGVIPSWQDQSGRFGFFPISNQVSYYRNVDDTGADRGSTLQIIAINGFKLWTDFSFELTADYNFDLTYGLDDDHYVELGLVKPITSLVSVNYQRIISTFEPEPINQFGVRLVF